MLTTTQKDIKNFGAIDVSSLTADELEKLESSNYTKIAVSHGIYGCNGLLFESNGQYYAITERSSTLLYFV